MAVLVTCLGAINGLAADGSRCESDLEVLDRVSRIATQTASMLRAERATAEQGRRELQDCLFFPSLYDTRDDRCRSMRVDYGYAKRRYETGKEALRHHLEDAESKLRAIEESCSDPVADAPAARLRAGRTLDPLCRVLPTHPTQVVPPAVLETCRSSIPGHRAAPAGPAP